MDKNTSPHENELKSLLPEPVTGSQSANEQIKNVQTQLEKPVVTVVEKIPGPSVTVDEVKNTVTVVDTKLGETKSILKSKNYFKHNKLVLINMIATALVIVGALNWGAHVMDVNLVEIVSELLNSLIQKLVGRNYNIRFNIVIYALVFTSAIILASQKSGWLPFLGQSVLPSTLVPLNKPSYFDTNVSIKTKPNVKVAYWASSPSKGPSVPFVTDAYGDFSNSGVVMSDSNGTAVLPVLAGSEYVVPSGRTIKRHVHWRVINENGMMGRVNTWAY